MTGRDELRTDGADADLIGGVTHGLGGLFDLILIGSVVALTLLNWLS